MVPGAHMWTGPVLMGVGPPQWAYRAQAPRILAAGDFISSELFCNFDMRQSRHQVAIAVGRVHDELERAADVVRSCYRAGIEKARVGVTFGEVAEAMVAPVEAAGGWVRGLQVHGMNSFGSLGRVLASRRQIPGTERFPPSSAYPYKLLGDMPLEPGMTFAFQPSCGFGPHLVTLGCTVVIADDGPIELHPDTAEVLRADG